MCWRRKTGRLQKIALKTEFYDRINASGKLFRFLIFIICGWFIDHTKNFRQCKDTKIFSDSTLVCITIQRGQRTINVCKELIPLFPKNEKPQNRVNSGVFGTPSGVRTLDTLIKSQVLCQLSQWRMSFSDECYYIILFLEMQLFFYKLFRILSSTVFIFLILYFSKGQSLRTVPPH